MSYESEVVSNAARQILAVAPKIEAYLKRETGKGYKLKKPFLRDGMTLHARFVGRKPASSASPFDFDSANKVWMNKKTGQKATPAEVDKWMSAPTMPDGFMLYLTYLPGPDLYTMRTAYITGEGVLLGDKTFNDMYVDALEDPELLFGSTVAALQKKESRSMSASLRSLTESLRTVLHEGVVDDATDALGLRTWPGHVSRKLPLTIHQDDPSVPPPSKKEGWKECKDPRCKQAGVKHWHKKQGALGKTSNRY